MQLVVLLLDSVANKLEPANNLTDGEEANHLGGNNASR